MANEQNLIPFTQRSKDEVREMNRKGGINSGKARLRNKRGRELMQAMLATKELDPQIVENLAASWGIDPKTLTKEIAMNARQVEKAIRKADTTAFKAVHQVAGTLEPEGATGNTVNVVISPQSAQAADKWCK